MTRIEFKLTLWLVLGFCFAFIALAVYAEYKTKPPVEIRTTESTVAQFKEQEAKNVETKKVEATAERRVTTVERFDPTTGVRVSRETARVVTEHKAKTYVLDKSTKQTDTQTKVVTTSEVRIAGASTSKVSIGILATQGGIGPSIGLRVAKLGPVGVDFTVGWHLVGNQGPRAGIIAAAEVMPRLELGIGAVIVPPLNGQTLGIVPAASLSYKF